MNAGFNVVVNLKLGGYEEELRIEREEAKKYFDFLDGVVELEDE